LNEAGVGFALVFAALIRIKNLRPAVFLSGVNQGGNGQLDRMIG
jgi:hypothetical protein